MFYLVREVNKRDNDCNGADKLPIVAQRRPLGEDIDFSSRLRAHAESIGCEYKLLRSNHVVTSCRKFDQFGDWYAIKLALFEHKRVKSMMDGSNTKDMDTYYYESRSGRSNKQSE